MANKLAGQKAKYTKALAEFNSTEDDIKKRTAARKLCEVLFEAPQNGFVEAEVTGGHEIPSDVQKMIEVDKFVPKTPTEDPDQLVRQLERKVDTSNLRKAGTGDQFMYAYGYRCAPDRLKVGRCEGDVIDRIASQINTSTPDKPALFLIIHTPDCRARDGHAWPPAAPSAKSRRGRRRVVSDDRRRASGIL